VVVMMMHVLMSVAFVMLMVSANGRGTCAGREICENKREQSQRQDFFHSGISLSYKRFRTFFTVQKAGCKELNARP
jgi:hypothetical protein